MGQGARGAGRRWLAPGRPHLRHVVLPRQPLADVVHPVAVHGEVALQLDAVLPSGRLRVQHPGNTGRGGGVGRSGWEFSGSGGGGEEGAGWSIGGRSDGCASPTDRKGRSLAEAKVRTSTHTRLLSGADGSCAAALVRDGMSKGGSGRSAQWCGPVAPCERSLLRDAALVPDLPPDARRGQGGDLGHQLPGPLTLA